jgi:hypothetical protein
MAITVHIGIVAAFAPASSDNTLINIASTMRAEISIPAPFSSSIRGRNPSCQTEAIDLQYRTSAQAFLVSLRSGQWASHKEQGILQHIKQSLAELAARSLNS